MWKIFASCITVWLLLIMKVQAQSISIPSGTVALSPLAGEIIKVEPLLDRTSNPATQITFRFVLQGCVDQLLQPLLVHSERQRQKVKLHITALNARNEASNRTRCIAIPTATAAITIPGTYRQNQIIPVFLGELDKR
jgi:hypothetical protein